MAVYCLDSFCFSSLGDICLSKPGDSPGAFYYYFYFCFFREGLCWATGSVFVYCVFVVMIEGGDSGPSLVFSPYLCFLLLSEVLYPKSRSWGRSNIPIVWWFPLLLAMLGAERKLFQSSSVNWRVKFCYCAGIECAISGYFFACWGSWYSANYSSSCLFSPLWLFFTDLIYFCTIVTNYSMVQF